MIAFSVLFTPCLLLGGGGVLLWYSRAAFRQFPRLQLLYFIPLFPAMNTYLPKHLLLCFHYILDRNWWLIVDRMFDMWHS